MRRTLSLCALLLSAASPALTQDNLREDIEGSLPRSWSKKVEWRSVGPANMGGRITSIAVHPTDTYTYWVGTAGGGVLKTTNNGVDYEHQFTRQNTASVGAITVAPSNPDHIWVGTGENNPRNSVSWGDGVYRSTDGGATWEHKGLRDSFQISTIIVHPEDENLVYVGVCGRLWGPSEERGLFKSADGGSTWEKVLFVDDKTGVIDIRMNPEDPNVLLAATYERERDIFCSNDPAKKWGEGSGIWRSEDAGDSWVKVTEGLPTVKLGRIGLDWYQADGNICFAIIETELITQEPPDTAYAGLTGEDAEVGTRLTRVTDEGPSDEAGLERGDVIVRAGDRTIIGWDEFRDVIKSSKAGDKLALEVVREGEVIPIELTFGNRPVPEDNTDELGYPRSGPYSGGLGGQRQNIQDEQGPEGFQYGGVYRSDDAGKTWRRINSVNPRPMYYSEIRVDPSDVNNIYVLGTSLYKSKDAGETFTADGADGSVHVDHHELWIDPNDGRHMILGNDGGIYVTWDRMERWDHHNHMAIGQFYNVTAGPRLDYWVYGGLQDNGSWGGPTRAPSGGGTINSDWIRIGHGDGFVCRVDENDPDQLYFESQNGGMGRRHLATGESGFIRPQGERNGPRYRFNWNTPFLLSNHNSRIHYSAGNHVFRSLDRGSNARRISPKVSVTERGSATSLDESPMNSNVLYVGTDDGGLWHTTDGGHNWVDLWTLNEGIETEAKAETVARIAILGDDDPLSGTWTCKAEGEGIESEEQGRFSLELTMAEGKLSGTIASDIGSGKLSGISWDEEKGDLRFRFQGENLTLDFDCEIEDGKMEGDITAAGGAFSFAFEGERTAKSESTDATDAAEEEPEVAADAEEAVEAPAADDEEGEDEEEAEEKPKERKFLKDTIDQLLPGRLYVSSIVASRHKSERVYVTFDGHRSDDDGVYVFVSNDHGKTWDALANNLPDGAGSVRDLDEDRENGDVLYLGTEFGSFVSVDRGKSWTELGSGLPTVAVHDYAQPSARTDLVAGTHGRSLWILDVNVFRQFTRKAREADQFLYEPSVAYRWPRGVSRGVSGTRRFVGENPSSSLALYYSLKTKARDLRITVQDQAGNVLREFPDAPAEKGLNRIDWDLRKGTEREDRRSGDRRFRRGTTLEEGEYRLVLEVNGETLEQPIAVVQVERE